MLTIDREVISSLLGLSLPAALSSGSGSQCSSAGACYSPGSAAPPGSSGTPSDPRAESKDTHVLGVYDRDISQMYRI